MPRHHPLEIEIHTLPTDPTTLPCDHLQLTKPFTSDLHANEGEEPTEHEKKESRPFCNPGLPQDPSNQQYGAHQ